MEFTAYINSGESFHPLQIYSPNCAPAEWAQMHKLASLKNKKSLQIFDLQAFWC
ncbi:MAG: hypothetical protein JWQ14_921 [Adhaeribacter sp.]|nr:hypothetical protein [Adhaeribacter sp.]